MAALAGRGCAVGIGTADSGVPSPRPGAASTPPGYALPWESGVSEVSSGDVKRHRLFRAGDRQLNCCVHTITKSQIQRDCPGRDYYLRKRATGKCHKEAM
jgi:hypothetical protein